MNLKINKKWLSVGGYFLVFLISFLLFIVIQSAAKTLLDPDSFYHAKIADFLAQGILIKDFPWLPYTIFSHSYIDHHFLYHLLLIPFVKIWQPLVGIKIATAFFATLTMVLFYWFLKRFKIKFPFFWTFLLLTSSVFLTRINLDKVPAVAIPVLLLSLYALFKKKYIFLSIMAFTYVWLYNTWPILLVAVIVYCFANALRKIIDQWQEIRNKGYWLLVIGYWLKYFFSKENIGLIFFCFLGIAGGLILNPYFPQNIYFDWVHIVQIGLKNYQNILPVGAEWYPYPPLPLITDNLLILFPWLIGLAWFFVSSQKTKNNSSFGQNTNSLTLFILSTLFFIYTVKSKRNIDYFIPLVVLFTSFSFNKLLTLLPWKLYFSELGFIKKNLLYQLITAVIVFLASIILIFATASLVKNVWLAKKNEFAGGAPFDKFKNAAIFLKENSQPNEIIFHSSWDEFPALFYHNDYNRYTAGLDPTFSYAKNKSLYWLWYNIITGKQTKNLGPTIKNYFHARLVLVKENYIDLKTNLEKDDHFKTIYQDKDALIYQLRD